MKRRGFLLGMLGGAALALLHAPKAQALSPQLRAVLFSPPFSPSVLFRAGEQGAWFDPSDLDSMRQESTGVTPAAISSALGLLLDKTQGMTIGAEVVTNGTFAGDSATGWTLGTGAAITGGQLVLTAMSTVTSTTFSPVVGVTYLLTFDVVSLTSASVVITFGSVTTSITSPGSKTFRITAIAATSLRISNNGTPTATLDNFSAKPIAGNHLTQATAASRSTLSAVGSYTALLSDGVDDSYAATTGGGASTAAFIQIAFRATQVGAAQTLWSDRTGNTGLKLEITAANALTFSGGNGASIDTVTGDTVSINTDYVATATYEGGVLSVRLNTAGTVTGACALSAGTAGFTILKDNGAASGFFNGYTYGLLYRKDSPVSATLAARSARWLGRKAGLSL